MLTRKRVVNAIAVSGVAAIAMAGCSASGAGPDGDAGGSEITVDLAAAEAFIEPYAAPGGSVPITTPLDEMPEPGSVVAYLDAGTPISTIMWNNLQPAADVLGITMQRVQTGSDPQSINTAMNSVVESEPDAVISVAIDPTLYATQLEALRAAGTVFVAASIVNGQDFGFDEAELLNGYDAMLEAGKVLVSTSLVRSEGKATDIAFYNIPEFPFAEVISIGAEEQLKELCPDCTLRVVNIPIAQLGSTASQTIVSDLQAHPETEAFIAALDEVQIGLPQAQEIAGLDVPGIGMAPSQLSLQQIADGTQDAALSTDLNMFTWMLMDQVARGLVGQPVEAHSARELSPQIQHIVTQESGVDATAGYVADPGYMQKFAELWTGK